MTTEIKRIPLSELAFPVLLLQREGFLIWPSAARVTPMTGSLIDSRGICFRMETLDLAPPAQLCYTGEPSHLSLHEVRDRIVWLVSAAGHFEIPQGLPSTVNFVDTIEELFAVLLTAGWSAYHVIPRPRI